MALKGRGRNKRFTNLSSVLNKVVSKYGIDKRLKEHTLMTTWEHLVGEPWSSLSKPVFFDYERNLVVAVRDSSVAQELSLRKLQILKSLTAMARSLGVSLKGVRFDIKSYSKIAEIEALESGMPLMGSGINAPKTPAEEDLREIELGEEHRSELENFQKSLDEGNSNHEVKKRFYEIYERDLRRRVWMEREGLRTCASCGVPDLRFYGEAGQCGPCFAQTASEQMNNSL